MTILTIHKFNYIIRSEINNRRKDTFNNDYIFQKSKKDAFNKYIFLWNIRKDIFNDYIIYEI